MEGEAFSSPRGPALRSLMCAARSRLSETLMSKRGRSKSVRQRGKLGKKGQEEIPCAPVFGVFSLSVDCHSFFSLHRIFSFLIYCLLSSVGLVSLSAHLSLSLSLTHTQTGSHARTFKQVSAHPAAIRQDSASASISRLFQFGPEPPGHCGTAQCLHTPPY